MVAAGKLKLVDDVFLKEKTRQEKERGHVAGKPPSWTKPDFAREDWKKKVQNNETAHAFKELTEETVALLTKYGDRLKTHEMAILLSCLLKDVVGACFGPGSDKLQNEQREQLKANIQKIIFSTSEK